MRPPFEKASMEKESVVKRYYDARFFKVSMQRLCQSYPLTIGFTVVFLFFSCSITRTWIFVSELVWSC